MMETCQLKMCVGFVCLYSEFLASGPSTLVLCISHLQKNACVIYIYISVYRYNAHTRIITQGFFHAILVSYFGSVTSIPALTHHPNCVMHMERAILHFVHMGSVSYESVAHAISHTNPTAEIM